jgi:hypothetical protein
LFAQFFNDFFQNPQIEDTVPFQKIDLSVIRHHLKIIMLHPMPSVDDILHR